MFKSFERNQSVLCIYVSRPGGLLLGSYFLLPLLEAYGKNDLVVQLHANHVWDHALTLPKIFLAPISFFLGKGFIVDVGVIFFVLVLLRFFIKPEKEDQLMKFSDTLLITSLLCLFCATNLFPWKLLKDYVGFIQFPWRLYIFISLFLSIAGAIILVKYLKEKKPKPIFIVVLFLLAIYPYFTIERYYYKYAAKGYLYDYDYYNISVGEYLPAGTDISKLGRRGEVVTSNNAQLNMTMTKNGNDVVIKYTNNDQENTYIEVPLLYYYGYTAVDEAGDTLAIKKGYQNIIRVFLKEEAGEVHVYYKGTRIQKYSLMVSIISWILFLSFLIYQNYLKEKE